ncbi:MAG: hypothetical protein FWD35_02695 [Oscillospiraceae bacterium]|nr:hypothetical protein [Oscillospiraceae bacterium]
MDMAKLLQMMMAGGMGDGNSDSSSEPTPPPEPDTASGNTDSADSGGFGDFGSFFENIDFDMIMKLGDMFSQMNKPDKNSALLTALKPHLQEEKHHKVDTAMKISRMITLLPLLKDSGVLGKLF